MTQLQYAFHNDPSLRSRVVDNPRLDGPIDLRWEKAHSLPRWFGWLFRHIIGMLDIRESSRPNKNPAVDLDIEEFQRSILSTIQVDTDMDAARFYLLQWLLEDFLPAAIAADGSEAYFEEILEILKQTASLRNRQYEGETLPSQLWNDLRERIAEAQLLSEQAPKPDKESTTYAELMHNKARRQSKTFIMRVALAAAEKNVHQAVANAVRDAIQAVETLNDCCNSKSYVFISEKLTKCLIKARAQALPTNDPEADEKVEKIFNYWLSKTKVEAA